VAISACCFTLCFQRRGDELHPLLSSFQLDPEVQYYKSSHLLSSLSSFLKESNQHRYCNNVTPTNQKLPLLLLQNPSRNPRTHLPPRSIRYLAWPDPSSHCRSPLLSAFLPRSTRGLLRNKCIRSLGTQYGRHLAPQSCAQRCALYQ
jgi:hypothetical protein